MKKSASFELKLSNQSIPQASSVCIEQKKYHIIVRQLSENWTKIRENVKKTAVIIRMIT